MPPNQITTANAGIALSFHVGHTWPGVAEFDRSAFLRLPGLRVSGILVG